MAANPNKLVSVPFRIVVCAALLTCAGLIALLLVKTKPVAAPSAAGGAAPRIVVMQAQPVMVRRQWEGFGTALPMDAANIPARVTATVIERPEHIRPGQSVTRGQLIVELDNSDFLRQVEIAAQSIEDIDAQLLRLGVEEEGWKRRAELAAEDVRLARSDYERVKQALANDAARQRELDQAKQALNTAERSEVAAREELDKVPPRRASLKAQRLAEQAAHRLASQSVERSRIVSPLDGILQAVDVEEGENISGGQRVARVVSINRVEVPLLLPASARAHVQAGDDALLTGSGSAMQAWSAQVTRIAPEDDQATRTMRVFVEVRQDPVADVVLAPGKFVQGIVTSAKLEERWVVPRRALEGDRVMLIEDGRVTSRTVEVDFPVQAEVPELGLPDRQWVALRQPLKPDALVVVDAARTLAEGSAAVPVLSTDVASSTPSDPMTRRDFGAEESRQ
jgi:RND family efflux transporter MFP subunit